MLRMADPANTARVVSEPKAWLALAHPLRLRILHHLQTRPAARATDLAQALGVAPNSMSFHLRQLARFGYVEPDDTARPDGREKWWRSTSPTGFRIEGPERDPAAASELAEVMRQRAHEQIDEWYDAVQVPEEEWDTSVRASNFDLHFALTGEEREEMLGELRTVFERWLELSRAGQGDDREEYVLFGYGLPQWAYDEVRRRGR
jgi:DNA-binding transcriptional ArsR family regulator